MDSVKVNKEDAEAVKMVTRMNALFVVDRNARELGLTAGERDALRREHTMPWVEEIRAECLKLRHTVLPKSALGASRELHAEPVAEAEAVFRVSGSRVVEQPGGRTRCGLSQSAAGTGCT